MVTISILCSRSVLVVVVIIVVVVCLSTVVVSVDYDYHHHQQQQLQQPQNRPVQGCNQEYRSLRSKIGDFGSPSFSHPFHSDVTCTYTFIGEEFERVQIIFKDVQLSHPPRTNGSAAQHGLYLVPPVNSSDYQNCEGKDSVTVSVYVGSQSKDIRFFCADQRPPMLMSIDHRLLVTFVKRSHSLGKGFRAQYNFVTDFGIKSGERMKGTGCEFEFHSQKTPNGTFTSPNFPGYYPRITECHYLFFGKDNERIYITFPYFDVEGVFPKCDETSESDYVEFSNFNVKLIDRKMNRLCGSKEHNTKNDVNSDGNFFRVTFKSNHVFDATGFEAFYQFRRVDDPYAIPKRPSRASDLSRTTSSMTYVTVFMTITTFDFLT